MTDKVESHIGTIAHFVEYIAKTLEVVLRNFRLTLTEMDGWNQVIELDGFDILFNNFAHLRAIPLILLEYDRVMDPWRQGLVGRQVHLHRLSAHIRILYPCFHA